MYDGYTVVCILLYVGDSLNCYCWDKFLPLLSMSSTKLALILCDKIQSIYQCMFIQARSSAGKRHGHRNQNPDTLLCIMSFLLCFIVIILLVTRQIVWIFAASHEWSTRLNSPIDPEVISSLSWCGTIAAALPKLPPLLGFSLGVMVLLLWLGYHYFSSSSWTMWHISSSH